MSSHTVRAYFVILSCLLLFNITGCSEKIDLGKWHMSKEGHQYFFSKAEISKKLKEIKTEWESDSVTSGGVAVGYKNIGSPPQEKIPGAESQSVFVSESGYLFLQITSANGTDGIEWTWKVTIDNRSDHPVRVALSYALLDKNGFALTKTRVQDAYSSLIKPNSTETIRKRDTWYVQSDSDPYKLNRVVRGDYGLTLKALPLSGDKGNRVEGLGDRKKTHLPLF